MHLRDIRLLLVILGVSNSKLQRVADQNLNLYNRAISSEGVLCIRKYWESHSSTFSKVPALALLVPGSIPKGLAPALFLELLARLTDLQQWQIWELWTSLDIHSCGLVGCPEFTLLVVLLCAGAAQQQMQAVHAYAGSISRVFLGAHVGSSYSGLAQCCQLMALPVSGLHTALKQQRMQQQGSSSGCCGRQSSSGGCGRHSSTADSPSVAAAAQAADGQMPSSGCRTKQHSLANANSLAAKCSSDNSIAEAGMQHAPQAEVGSSAAAAAAMPQPLGCCCSHAGSPQPQRGQQQWACGAAAHRLQAMQGSTSCHDATLLADSSTAADCTLTYLPAEDMEFILYQVAEQHACWRSGSDKLPAEVFSPGCWGSCTIC